MEGEKYDIVVFGATGFTGQFVVDEVARAAEAEKLTWAVAGRTMAKIQKVLQESSERLGKNVEETAIIIADTSSPNSLLEMAKQAKVVLNCVGPYRFYGEPVVKACIEGGAHHLDISGEPQFLERMQLLYNGPAKENGVYIIGAVGFDSIPGEMGLEYTRKQFKGELSNVECFFQTQSGPDGFAVNTGTFESAVYGLAHMNELKPLRRSLYTDPMPRPEYRLPSRTVFFSQDVNKWCLPFVGSDRSVVNRTTRDLLTTKRLDKPIEFIPYMCTSGLFNTIALILFGMIFAVLTKFSFGQQLLIKYPGLFSGGTFKKGGPTMKQIEGCSFSWTFIGHGYSKPEAERTSKKPDKKIITKVMGPEPGYVTTPICMVQSAVVLLLEKDKLYHKAGVLTAGSAFHDTNLIERLEKNRMKFVTVSDGSDSAKSE